MICFVFFCFFFSSLFSLFLQGIKGIIKPTLGRFLGVCSLNNPKLEEKGFGKDGDATYLLPSNIQGQAGPVSICRITQVSRETKTLIYCLILV